MEQYEQSLEDRLRRQSFKRTTDYIHPEVTLNHHPINALQCQELRNQLKDLVRQKVDKVRREYESQDYSNKYDQVYSEFIRMATINESEHQQVCNNIREMHEIADILLQPPKFNKDLFLYSSQKANSLQVEEYNQLYKHYQKLHKSGHQIEENQSQQILKRAKQYYLRDRS